MYKATSGEKTFNIDLAQGQFEVDGQSIPVDIAEIGPGRYHIISNSKTFLVEIVSVDVKSKKCEIKVNGITYPIQVADKMDVLLEKMGIEVTAEERTVEITAPMPGLILDISVKAGDKVEAGDKLMVLEAMKMENVIKAPAGAILSQIKVKIGESVEFGQSLIQFE